MPPYTPSKRQLERLDDKVEEAQPAIALHQSKVERHRQVSERVQRLVGAYRSKGWKFLHVENEAAYDEETGLRVIYKLEGESSRYSYDKDIGKIAVIAQRPNPIGRPFEDEEPVAIVRRNATFIDTAETVHWGIGITNIHSPAALDPDDNGFKSFCDTLELMEHYAAEQGILSNPAEESQNI